MIAVFGASGMVGSRVVAEAVSQGLEVLAITRSGAEVPGATKSIAGDMGDAAVYAALPAEVDTLVSVTPPSRTGESHDIWLAAVDTLIAQAGDRRIVFTGGAGSLLVDGVRLVDSPEFPEAYKAEALSAGIALDKFRAATGVNWTYLSPSPGIAPGERHDSYVLGLDAPAGDFVTAEDFAHAMVDEIVTPAHVNQRFTVASA